MERSDRGRVLDYDAAGRLIAIELLDVSGGVRLDGLPGVERPPGADLLAVGEGAA